MALKLKLFIFAAILLPGVLSANTTYAYSCGFFDQIMNTCFTVKVQDPLYDQGLTKIGVTNNSKSETIVMQKYDHKNGFTYFGAKIPKAYNDNMTLEIWMSGTLVRHKQTQIYGSTKEYVIYASEFVTTPKPPSDNPPKNGGGGSGSGGGSTGGGGNSGGGTSGDTPSGGTTTTPAEPATPLTATIPGGQSTVPSLVATKNCPSSGAYETGLLKGVVCNGATKSLDTIVTVIRNVITVILLPLAGTIFTLMLIVGGLIYITSAGNEKRIEMGKKTLTAAVIGLLIVALSFTLVRIFASVLGGGISTT